MGRLRPSIKCCLTTVRRVNTGRKSGGGGGGGRVVGIAIWVGNDRQSGRGRMPGKVRMPTSLEHAHRNVAGQSKQ